MRAIQSSLLVAIVALGCSDSDPGGSGTGGGANAGSGGAGGAAATSGSGANGGSAGAGADGGTGASGGTSGIGASGGTVSSGGTGPDAGTGAVGGIGGSGANGGTGASGGGGSGGTGANAGAGGSGAVGGTGGSGGSGSAGASGSGGSSGSSGAGGVGGSGAPCTAESATVDAGPGVGDGVDVTVVGDGTVYIAYSDDAKVDMKVAVRAPASGAWTKSVIDYTGFAYARGPSIASWNDEVTIFYESSAGGYALKPPGGSFSAKSFGSLVEHSRGTHGADLIRPGQYAHVVAGPLGQSPLLSWETFADPDCTPVEGDRAVRRDSQAGVHVVTRCGSSKGPFYAYKSGGGTWKTHLIDASGGTHIALAIDPNDVVHVLYRRDYSNAVYHAWRSTTQSLSAFTLSQFAAGSGPLALLVDAQGNLHAFHRPTLATLVHRVKPLGSTFWSAQPDVDSTEAGGDVAAVLGPDGAIHVAYQDASIGRVKYARICP